MIYLTLTRGSYLHLQRNSTDLFTTGHTIYRNFCHKRQSVCAVVSRSSITAHRYVPRRLLLMKTKQSKGFRPKYRKDKVSTDFKLIYRCYTHDQLLMMFYCFGLGISGLFTSVYYCFISVMRYNLTQPVDIPGTGLTLRKSTCHMILIGSLLMLAPIFIHCRLQSKKIVRLYNQKDSDFYVGIMKRHIFRNDKIEFTLKDVVPTIHKKFGEKGNIMIKGKEYIVFETDFINQDYINALVKRL